MTTLAEHQVLVDSAEAKSAAARQALLTPDGRRRFADDEHARLEAEIAATHRQTLVAAGEAAERELTAARADLAGVTADPITTLPADDLSRANALREFVREDCEQLPLAVLADRIEQGLTADRPTAALLLRYGRSRLEQERQGVATRSGALDGLPANARQAISTSGKLLPDGEHLVAALTALEARFIDRRRQAALEGRIEKAQALVAASALRLHQHRTYAGWDPRTRYRGTSTAR